MIGSIGKSASKNSDPAINFKGLLGEWHWRWLYGKLYKEQDGQWLTPVELFRPYYSAILANFISHEVKASAIEGKAKQLHIVELGGGRGTNAIGILDHLRDSHPGVYNNLSSYTIMDASPTLIELQRSILLGDDEVGGRRDKHADLIRLEQKDMLDVAEGRIHLLDESECLTVVLAMEVLDNLPHDKVKICKEDGSMLQTELHLDQSSGLLKEVYRPMDDALLQKMLAVYPAYAPTTSRAKWVPTVATQVIAKLYEQRPNARIIFADFDYLPEPMLEGVSGTKSRRTEKAELEPLVTDMNDIDHPDYLVAPPLCDVLFPTDFEALAGYTRAIVDEAVQKTTHKNSLSVSVAKQSDFLTRYGEKEVEATRSWLNTHYTPLLHDFSNCSILYVTT